MGREHVHYTAPPRAGLESGLDRFLLWFNAAPAGLDGLLLAGLAHLWFATLHPFEDGNGRLARAIADMALSRDEGRPMRLFSLSAQILREREDYYEILERTQRGGLEVTGWLNWFLARVECSAEAAERTLANTLSSRAAGVAAAAPIGSSGSPTSAVTGGRPPCQRLR
jgi:Fic family protein